MVDFASLSSQHRHVHYITYNVHKVQYICYFATQNKATGFMLDVRLNP